MVQAADENRVDVDALMPPSMALKAEAVGVAKASMAADRLFVLAVLAGAFIAHGALFAIVVGTGSDALPFGVGRLLVGAVFSLGLILVVIGGAELFTGNNLIVMAWASGKVSAGAVLRNWAIVFVGNFVGALGTAVLAWLAGVHTLAGGAVGWTAIGIAQHKLALGFGEAVALGILCNTLVCLAIWLSFSARTTTDRILAIVPPVTAFVASGFEHSIANMFFVPMGMLAEHTAGGSHFANQWGSFFTANLLPVSIGNIIGGALLVGAVYWFVYLKPRRSAGLEP